MSQYEQKQRNQLKRLTLSSMKYMSDGRFETKLFQFKEIKKYPPDLIKQMFCYSSPSSVFWSKTFILNNNTIITCIFCNCNLCILRNNELILENNIGVVEKSDIIFRVVEVNVECLFSIKKKRIVYIPNILQKNTVDIHVSNIDYKSFFFADNYTIVIVFDADTVLYYDISTSVLQECKFEDLHHIFGLNKIKQYGDIFYGASDRYITSFKYEDQRFLTKEFELSLNGEILEYTFKSDHLFVLYKHNSSHALSVISLSDNKRKNINIDFPRDNYTNIFLAPVSLNTCFIATSCFIIMLKIQDGFQVTFYSGSNFIFGLGVIEDNHISIDIAREGQYIFNYNDTESIKSLNGNLLEFVSLFEKKNVVINDIDHIDLHNVFDSLELLQINKRVSVCRNMINWFIKNQTSITTDVDKITTFIGKAVTYYQKNYTLLFIQENGLKFDLDNDVYTFKFNSIENLKYYFDNFYKLRYPLTQYTESEVFQSFLSEILDSYSEHVLKDVINLCSSKNSRLYDKCKFEALRLHKDKKLSLKVKQIREPNFVLIAYDLVTHARDTDEIVEIYDKYIKHFSNSFKDNLFTIITKEGYIKNFYDAFKKRNDMLELVSEHIRDDYSLLGDCYIDIDNEKASEYYYKASIQPGMSLDQAYSFNSIALFCALAVGNPELEGKIRDRLNLMEIQKRLYIDGPLDVEGIFRHYYEKKDIICCLSIISASFEDRELELNVEQFLKVVELEKINQVKLSEILKYSGISKKINKEFFTYTQLHSKNNVILDTVKEFIN